MAPKRKSHATNSANKRAKAGPSPEEYGEFYVSTLNLVYDLRDDNNERELVNPFIKLPSKKQYPDYTKIVTDPITISDIQRKVRGGKYSETSTAEFLADFKLLLHNAKLYNDPSSWIVEDATKIYEFVKDQVVQFTGEEPEDDDEDSKNKELVREATAVVNELIDHNFPKIGVISQPFMEVVDRDEYPDYFEVIKNPTSFQNVLDELDGTIVDHSDTVENNLQSFYDAVHLIFTNAQTYNAEESLLYKDAAKLSSLFEEKFESLKQRVLGAENSKLKIKLKAPKLKEASPVVADSPSPVASPAPRPRGRRRKVVEPEEEDVIKADDIDDPEEDASDSEEADESGDEDMDVDQDEDSEEEKEPVIPTLESNVMGRTTTLGSTEENFIQHAYIGSSASTVPQISSQIQELNGYRVKQPPSRYQLIKSSLFSSEPDSISTLFEYNFPANGYRTQSYSLSLPPDSSSFVTFSFSLHEYLYALQQSYGSGGSADEEFQYKLFVNEEEVQSQDVSDFEGKEAEAQLKINYDLKLNNGLNLVTFECKVAPSASKVIRKSETKQEEKEEIAGRHTRHQLQQMKMSWEVEKITLFIVCNSA